MIMCLCAPTTIAEGKSNYLHERNMQGQQQNIENGTDNHLSCFFLHTKMRMPFESSEHNLFFYSPMQN